MSNADALKILQDYYDNDNPGEDDEIEYTEALKFLIETTKNPDYMCELAWFYCEKKRFDVEIRYLEMAAECGSLSAMEELGYMWYYGQHGEQDYEKAFYYFSKGAENDEGNGSLWCRYKLADMYRYGCYVEKDEDKYRRMIRDVYEEIKEPRYLNEPFPEIALRMAGIYADEGDDAGAVKLLRQAKSFLAERLSIDAFWGHIEVMGRIVRFLYELTPIYEPRADFYDLFYLTKTPGEYSMMRGKKKMTLSVSEEDGECAIKYDGRWYRDFADFLSKAEFDGQRVTAIYDEFYDMAIKRPG